MARRLNGRGGLLPAQRRSTFTLGEEQRAALLVELELDDGEPEVAVVELTNEEKKLAEAMFLVKSSEAGNVDSKQEAFTAFRRAVVHVNEAQLDNMADEAKNVLSFLLDNYRYKSINRNLIETTLQKLITSKKWRLAAKTLRPKAVAVFPNLLTSKDDLGQLAPRGVEKVAQLLDVFDVTFADLAQIQEIPAARIESVKWPRSSKLIGCAAFALCIIWTRSGGTNYQLCSAIRCPKHYAPKAEMMRSRFKCSDTSCASELDILTCCQLASTCDSMMCPAGAQLIANASSVQCRGATCTMDADLERCCRRVGDEGVAGFFQKFGLGSFLH